MRLLRENSVRVDIMGDARFDLQGRRVCVAGHSGMLGSALVRRLVEEDCRLLPLGRETLDLRDQAAVFAWFGEYRPDVVFVAAATVGGIYANDRQPADFLYDNLAIAANVIEAARRSEVRKLVFFGTSRSEEHTSELQSPYDLVCRLLLEKKN